MATARQQAALLHVVDDPGESEAATDRAAPAGSGTRDRICSGTGRDSAQLSGRLYVEQFSRDGDQRPPYDDRRADVPL